MRKSVVRVMGGLFVASMLGVAGCGGGGSDSGGTNNGGGGGGGGTVTHSYVNTTVGSTRTYSNGMTETVLTNGSGSFTMENVDGTYIKQDTMTVNGTAIAITSSKEMNASRVVTNTITFSPAMKIFPSSTTVGFTENQSVTASSTSPSGPSGTGNCTLSVLAVESVTVTAGTFSNAIKIGPVNQFV